MDADQVAQLLAAERAFRDAETDPELEALRLAVLLESALGITLGDDEIDLALLSDPQAVAALQEQHRDRP